MMWEEKDTQEPEPSFVLPDQGDHLAKRALFLRFVDGYAIGNLENIFFNNCVRSWGCLLAAFIVTLNAFRVIEFLAFNLP